tara:strand:- start:923 stop:1669 length:747 start_codon:yes stop_codon:yes gene_type:complete
MIKTLYTNGDSWTFGQELKDDEADHLTHKFYNSWPWHLSQHLRIPQLVNDALGGTSNYRILRRTLDYIQNYKGKYKELMVVVAWTTYERKEVPVEILRKHNNGHTAWEENNLEYVSVLMNSVPDVDTGDSVVDRTILDWHKTSTMLNSQQHNAKEFYNQQWTLKHVCKSLGINLLQCYALDNPEFAGQTANKEWLEQIMPLPTSLNRMLMAIEHEQDVRAPLRHPNEEGHKYIAEQIQSQIPFFKNYT